MKTGWPYDAGTSEIGDRPDEPLADRAAGREHPPFEAPAAPVNVPAPRAEDCLARAENLPGEQATTDQLRSVRLLGRAGHANPAGCAASACLLTRWWPMAAAPATTCAGTARTHGHAPNAGPPLRQGRRPIGQDTETSTRRAEQATYTRRPASAGIRLAFDQASTGHMGITKRLRSGLRLSGSFLSIRRVNGICAGDGRCCTGACPASPRIAQRADVSAGSSTSLAQLPTLVISPGLA